MSWKHDLKFSTKESIRPRRPFASVVFLSYFCLFLHFTREPFFLVSGSRFYFFCLTLKYTKRVFKFLTLVRLIWNILLWAYRHTVLSHRLKTLWTLVTREPQTIRNLIHLIVQGMDHECRTPSTIGNTGKRKSSKNLPLDDLAPNVRAIPRRSSLTRLIRFQGETEAAMLLRFIRFKLIHPNPINDISA